ncbi:hypothetical protein PWG15_34735 (plasmid) [Ensifer adhaerens]|uniref:hypothetical protein n=1 Tax=Ensifer adhaerens TaxID=106592 RepID=UPI0023A9DE51|nr:hypothetical protein [Ensifer adhaerens]WDZ81507.1 hypothetical protein PWG15_34735 [Ensifer adhaerens]
MIIALISALPAWATPSEPMNVITMIKPKRISAARSTGLSTRRNGDPFWGVAMVSMTDCLPPSFIASLDRQNGGKKPLAF